MYGIVRTKDFEKSVRKLRRSGKFSVSAEGDLADVIDTLASGKTLPKSYFDHALKGEYAGYRECHIKGDLLLVYVRKEKILVIVLVDIDTHSGIFG